LQDKLVDVTEAVGALRLVLGVDRPGRVTLVLDSCTGALLVWRPMPVLGTAVDVIEILFEPAPPGVVLAPGTTTDGIGLLRLVLWIPTVMLLLKREIDGDKVGPVIEMPVDCAE
jgi:hypothetical protein